MTNQANDERARAAAEAQRAELANVIEVAAIALDTKGHPAGTYWEGFAVLVGRYVDKLVADAVAEALTERDRHWIDRTVSTDVYSEATRKWTETIRERDQLAEEIARLREFIQVIADSQFDEDGHPQAARLFLAKEMLDGH